MNKSEFNKLKRSLLKIEEDVRGLLISRFFFKEVQKIIATNPKIQIGSWFYTWMSKWYADYSAMGIRRHVDKDPRSQSLIQLLEEVEKHSSSFTLTRFQKLYPKDMRSDIAPSEFKQFSGNHLKHLNPSVVRKDIKTLKKTVQKITHFTNKRIAHFDRLHFRAIPTFDHLDSSLNKLERLVKKYIFLFTGVNSDLVPTTFGEDWKAIFKYPWIKKSKNNLARTSTRR